MRNKLKGTLQKLHLYNLAKLFYKFLKFRFFFLEIGKKFYYFFVPTATILIYHRVADVKNDPHLLSVSPDNFYKQLKYLQQNFQVIKLSELVENLRTKQLKNKSVAITFDDGYADNLYNALPILEKLKIPATIFAVAGRINSQTSFYWDENTPKQDAGRALTSKELINLASSPLVEIGSHTITHFRLSQLLFKQQKREIAESKKIIEKYIKKPVNSFSYPFGEKKDFNKGTAALVKKTGYQYACANIQGRVTKKSDLFLLPRKLIRNWDLNQFKSKIKI